MAIKTIFLNLSKRLLLFSHQGLGKEEFTFPLKCKLGQQELLNLNYMSLGYLFLFNYSRGPYFASRLFSRLTKSTDSRLDFIRSSFEITFVSMYPLLSCLKTPTKSARV
jgi:hypothetical protein